METEIHKGAYDFPYKNIKVGAADWTLIQNYMARVPVNLNIIFQKQIIEV